jgi:hypothetical protein
MMIAHSVRDEVSSWLAEHPGGTPPGFAGRHQSNQEELDALASEVERRAEASAAAAAAERGEDEAAGWAAARVLERFADAVELRGRPPRGRHLEYLGVYDRTDELELVAGRFAYRKRGTHEGPSQPMLWFAENGFWHAGEKRFLGQPTGWLIVGDRAPAPEHIAAVWQV